MIAELSKTTGKTQGAIIEEAIKLYKGSL
ncbi:hypothetical protein O970_02825 [Candidatus Schmidhempelia bombi str. Bimp]|uniref:Ribbon-helix-helix domain-containing protein n=1 Tax=Candidatus Schmidhempelia bombi str. Bimp TaxID=1387197 RepID=A0AB94IE20_9GAMM|nr:hypothetical protein O970_02825 [Candidatus Schmidhempelia bombi str. Bimp]